MAIVTRKSERQRMLNHEKRNTRVVAAGVRDSANRWRSFKTMAVTQMADTATIPDVRTFMMGYVETLTDAMVLAYLRGIERTLASAAPYLAKQAGLQLSVYDDAISAHAAQLAISNNDLIVLRDHFRGVSINAMTAAPTSIQPRLNQALSVVVEKGMTKAQAIPFLRGRLGNIGLGPSPSTHLLETYYRTGVQSAYQGGRWQSAQDPDIASILWGYEYSTVGDSRVREEHAMLEGTTLPKKHPFWQQYYPPNGWNCRCTALEIFSLDKGVPKGVKMKNPPKDYNTVIKDKRFIGNPGVEVGYQVQNVTSNIVSNVVTAIKLGRLAGWINRILRGGE